MKRLFEISSKLVIVLMMIALSTLGTSCTNDKEVPDPDLVAYNAADGLEGARLYDTPINYKETTTAGALAYKHDFFRCKSCHGWDLLGQKGVLINKPSSASYPVASTSNLYQKGKELSIRQLYDAIANKNGTRKVNGTDAVDSTHPNYSTYLTSSEIWNLVKFLKETAHNMDDFYKLTTTGTYPTGTKVFSEIGKNGNAVNGQKIYTAKCAGCHGVDGTKIDVYCQKLGMGTMFREDPHEVQHKAPWGMPTDYQHESTACPGKNTMAMPLTGISDQDIRDLMIMGKDEVKFPAIQ